MARKTSAGTNGSARYFWQPVRNSNGRIRIGIRLTVYLLESVV